MDQMKFLPGLLLALGLTGCNTTPTTTQQSPVQFTADHSQAVVAGRISTMAKRCWARKRSASQYGVLIESYPFTKREHIVNAYPVGHFSNEDNMEPFLTIVIGPGKRRSTVKVYQYKAAIINAGGYNYPSPALNAFLYLSNTNIKTGVKSPAETVRAWAAGSLNCHGS